MLSPFLTACWRQLCFVFSPCVTLLCMRPPPQRSWLTYCNQLEVTLELTGTFQKCSWESRHHTHVDADLTPERRLAVSNHTVSWQYAGSACSVCMLKAKAEAANRRTFVMAVMRHLCAFAAIMKHNCHKTSICLFLSAHL